MSGVALWLGVGVLGGLASVGRFIVDGFVSSRMSGRFPIGTFVVNVSGSFLLGIITGLSLTGDALLLVGTAVLGSYTTFSTWMFESHRLAEEGDLPLLAANLLGGLAFGIAAIALGRWIGS